VSARCIRLPSCALAAALALLAPAVRGPSAASAESASPWVDGYNSRVRLIAGARGGNPVAGIEIQMAEGWKTYWRSPGDSGGVPPHFDWAASSNLAGAQVLFPAPHRMTDPAGDAIGYKGAVVIPVTITPQDGSKPVGLSLALEFGICKDICVPAEAKLNLELPPGRADSLPPELANALERIPRKAASRRDGDPEFLGGKATLEGPSPKLMFEARFQACKSGADAFLEAPDGIYVPLPRKTAQAADGTAAFEVDLASGAEPGDLKGKTLTVTLVCGNGQSEAQWALN